MEIENNYEGASIDIIRNEKNKIYLSLKKENGKYSHYYNFRIKNNLDEQGIIYIKNITNSAYYKKESFSAPYIKENNQWKKVEEYVIDDKGRLVLKVKQKTTCEISLLTRYVQKNLDEFIEKNNLNNLKISKNPLNEIIIGDRNLPSVVIVARQHPGETLSSFFVEGIIQEIINDTKLQNKYCFDFYPLLNEDGVNNGNHRYL